MISVAVVSHGQQEMAWRLIAGLERFGGGHLGEIVLIENRRRGSSDVAHPFRLPVHQRINPRPQGLAANVNAAFRLCRGDYFCTINPDIRIEDDVFGPLLDALRQGSGDIVAPRIVDEHGRIQDSARAMPRVRELLARRLVPGRLRPYVDEVPTAPDWIAGMFLLMPARVFRDLGGMDERYYLYFEDVDFGTRARLRGYRLYVEPSASVIHEARRASRRDPRYLARHLASAVRFFLSRPYWEARRLRRGGGPAPGG